MHSFSLALRLIALCALFWLAVVDVRERRLPTRIVLAIGGLFLIDAAVDRMPGASLLAHAALACCVFAVCALLFAARMLGGGDAKLAAVIFLWTGPALSLPTLALISVIGTLVSCVSLATRRLNDQQPSAPRRALAMFSSQRGVPYGVALALGGGTTIVLPAVLPFLTR
ncbi:MAG: A24 family peptidase [Janthinobacterium lividum]